MIRPSIQALIVSVAVTLTAAAQPVDSPQGQWDSIGKDKPRASGTHAMVELQAVHTGDYVPFWMRAMQHGNTPLAGSSIAAIGSYERGYGKAPGKTDIGFGLKFRGDVGSQVRGTVLEAYVKARFKAFELKAGRFRQVQGLSDTTLGMGNYSQSGNSLPIPMIQLGMPDYSFPLLDSLLSFKGTFSQGWMGETPTKYMNNLQTLPQFMHQKSLHIRIGKPRSKVKGVVGLVHQVFWVNNRKLYGDSIWKLSPLETYFYIVTAKRYIYKPGFTETTTVGNNLGHFDLGLDIAGSNHDIRLYRQIFYESVRTLADGITGVSIVNRSPAKGGFRLGKLVLEYMSSMDQGYEPDAVPEKYDNYYNHEFLYDGVAYRGAGIGNPFISLRSTIRRDLPASNPQIIAFNNTRVRALHVGVEWLAGPVLLCNRFSFSRNFGMYSTKNSFPPSSQFSMGVEAAMPIRKGWQARAMFALDSGELLYNTAGGFLSIARTF
jgi:hypothetical protein